MDRMTSGSVLAILALTFVLLTACGRVPGGVVSPSPGVASVSSVNTAVPIGQMGIAGANGWPVPRGMMTDDGLKYGYLGNTGSFIVQPVFQSVMPFASTGLAVVVNSEGKSGVIDTTGKQVVPWQQASISLLDNGMILVYLMDGDGSFTDTEARDASGALVFRQKGFLEPYAEGFAPSTAEGRRGYLDEKGNLAIPLKAEDLGSFSGGYAQVAVKYGEPRHYIGIDGKDATATVSNGLSVFVDAETNRFGYKKADGSLLVPATLVEAEPFRNGTAIVQFNADMTAYAVRYGLMGLDGKWRIQPEHSGIRRLENGLFAVGEKLKNATWMPYGYMQYSSLALYEANGSPLTDFILTGIQDAGDGFTALCDGKKIWFVDAAGQKADSLPSVPGEGILRLDNGYLTGNINGFDTILNRAGQTMAVLKSETDLGNGWFLTDEKAAGNRFSHLMFPVLSGMSDSAVMAKINAAIRAAMGTAIVREPQIDEQTGVADVETIDGGWKAWRIGNLLCIEQEAYAYSLGAAHGMPMLQTLHIDSGTGRLYKLAELFKTDAVRTAMDILSKFVTDKIILEMDEVGYFVESVKVTPEQSFRLTGVGITLYWPPYELASYAAGFREFSIPWSELESVIDRTGPLWKAMKLP